MVSVGHICSRHTRPPFTQELLHAFQVFFLGLSLYCIFGPELLHPFLIKLPGELQIISFFFCNCWGKLKHNDISYHCFQLLCVHCSVLTLLTFDLVKSMMEELSLDWIGHWTLNIEIADRVKAMIKDCNQSPFTCTDFHSPNAGWGNRFSRLLRSKPPLLHIFARFCKYYF